MAENSAKLEELKDLQGKLSATIKEMESGEDTAGAVWEYDAATAPVAWYIAYGTSNQAT
jgi:hypothetical protein